MSRFGEMWLGLPTYSCLMDLTVSCEALVGCFVYSFDWNWRLSIWHHDHEFVGHVIHSSEFIDAIVFGSIICQVKLSYHHVGGNEFVAY